MDFSAIFQIRTKRFWWMDVIFYFAVSLLMAAIFCYLIFWVKNGFQREDIKKEIAALETVGTSQQKEEEKTVINYQKKISDFTDLLNNHEFASNAFAFMEAETMPNIWFKQFALDEKNAGVQLSGEADSMDAFSRQVAVFEKNKYVTNIASLNSSLGNSARIAFNMSLVLSQDIFSYLSSLFLIPEATAPSGQSPAQQSQTSEGQAALENQTPANQQQASQTKSAEKLITSFRLLLKPEVIGVLDQTNYIVTLNVPYGTDVKNLTPSIMVSPEAAVSPASDVLQNFENPVVYTVTAQDGSAQNYEAKAIVGSPPESAKKAGQSGSSLLIIIVIAAVVAVVTAIILIFVWRKMKAQKQNF